MYFAIKMILDVEHVEDVNLTEALHGGGRNGRVRSPSRKRVSINNERILMTHFMLQEELMHFWYTLETKKPRPLISKSFFFQTWNYEIVLEIYHHWGFDKADKFGGFGWKGIRHWHGAPLRYIRTGRFFANFKQRKRADRAAKIDAKPQRKQIREKTKETG